jgi:hypothetical protein
MKRRPLASSVVANLCEAHSWDDDLNDGARRALELANHHILRLAARVLRCAMRAEHFEAKCQRLEEDNRRMAKYLKTLLKQQGGAA